MVAEVVRRPAGRRILIWLLIWVAISVVLGVLYSAIPPSPDQALFDYIGWRILGGATPYAEVVELNWPGAMFLHAASTWLFGNTLHAWRTFDYLYLMATVVLIFLAVRSFAGWKTAAAAGVVYQILYVTAGPWFSGQRDIVAAPFLLVACYAQARGLRDRSLAWQALAGPAVGMAMVIKPTLGAVVLMLAIQAGVHWMRRRIPLGAALLHLCVTGAALLLTLAMFAAGARVWGFLDDWWEMSIRFNSAVYALESAAPVDLLGRICRFAVPSWHWLLLASAAGLYLLRRSRTAWLPSVTLALLGTTAISCVVQQKGFGYHLGPVLMVLAVLTAVVLAACIKTMTERPRKALSPRVLAAGAILLVASLGLASKLKREFTQPAAWILGHIAHEELLRDFNGGDTGVTMADVLNASSYIASRSNEKQPVLLWGRSVLVKFLAQRRSPTRFCHAYMLWAAGSAFEKSGAWAEEFRSAMAAAPPVFIVLTKKPGGGWLWIQEEDRAESVALLLDALSRNYRKAAQFGGLEVYQHVHSRVSPAATISRAGASSFSSFSSRFSGSGRRPPV